MAKFTGDVRDVNVGSAGSPVAPVQKQVASRAGEAQAIRDLGRTVAEGAVTIQKVNDQSIINDYTAKAQDDVNKFLESEADLSDTDKQAIKSLQDLVNQQAAAGKSSGRVSEFKVRSEAELKKAIAANPHLAPELRKAAAGALGFQPIGEQLRQLESSQRASQTLLQNQMNDLDKMAQKMNYLPGEIFTDPAKQQEFLTRVEANRVTMKMQEMKAGQEAGLVSGKVYQAEFMTNLPKVVMAGRDQLFNSFTNDMKNIASANGIDLGNITSPLQLTPEIMAQVINNPTAKKALENQIALYEQSVRAQTLAATSSFEEQALRTSVMETMLAPVEQLKTLLSSEGNIQYFKDQTSLMTTLATNNMYQSRPELAQLEAITKSLGNLTALPQVQMDLWNGGVKSLTDSLLNSVKFNADGTTTTNYNAGDPDTTVIRDAKPSELQPLVNHFVQLANAAEGSNPEVVSAMLNQYGKIFASPEMTANKPAMDSLFKMMGDPANKAALMDWMDQNPELGRNVKRMYSSYARNSVAQLGKMTNNLIRDLDLTIDTRDKENVLLESPLKINYAGGKFIMTLDEDKLNTYVGAYGDRGERVNAQVKEGIRRDMQRNISKWQTQFLQPLNRYVRDWNELSGAGDEDFAAGELVKGTPLEAMFNRDTGKPVASNVVIGDDGKLTVTGGSEAQPTETRGQPESGGEPAPEGIEDGLYDMPDGSVVEVVNGIAYKR